MIQLRFNTPLTLLALAVVGRKGFALSTCSAQTTTQNPSYAKLKTKLKEIENLSGVRGLLGWDEMVLMSPGSSQARNEQNAALASVLHEKQTSPELSLLITELLQPEQYDTLDSEYDRAVVRDASRDYRIESGKTSEQAMLEAELQGQIMYSIYMYMYICTCIYTYTCVCKMCLVYYM